MSKNFFDKNGVEYQLLKTCKTEREAIELTNRLENEAKSKRFCPIIERVVVTFLRDKWLKHSKYRVFVPVNKKT